MIFSFMISCAAFSVSRGVEQQIISPLYEKIGNSFISSLVIFLYQEIYS